MQNIPIDRSVGEGLTSGPQERTRDVPMRLSSRSFREEVLATLGLRCVFPATIVSDYVAEIGALNKSTQLRHGAARSMLEAISDEKLATPFDSILEDVVIRCIERCEQAGANTKLSSAEVINYNILICMFKYILSLFYFYFRVECCC